MKRPLPLVVLACLLAGEAQPGSRYEETRRIPAVEAGQGVAADATHLYAVGNHSIGKHRKDTGERVAHWECPEGKPLTHKRSIDFGVTDGSLTWIDRRDGRWIACFVHYAGRGGVPRPGPESTRLVEFDDHGKQLREWKLPQSVIKDLSSRGYSLSGGAIGPGGLLCVTGHDEKVLHVIRFPEAGDQLEDVTEIPVSAGAGVILTSEGCLDGYLGHRKMHPEMTHERLWEIAEPVDGQYVTKAAVLARERSVHIVFCFSERRGGKVFNTAALINPEGRVLGTYSRSHTGGVEWYEPGSEFPVWDTPVGKIGILICFDRQIPETSRMLGLKGAEMILIPAHSPAVDRINEDVMMRVRAFENNAFVVLANPFNPLVSNPWGGDHRAEHRPRRAGHRPCGARSRHARGRPRRD